MYWTCLLTLQHKLLHSVNGVHSCAVFLAESLILYRDLLPTPLFLPMSPERVSTCIQECKKKMDRERQWLKEVWVSG